jgi:tetratricopeptide (TPR) repeat protein
MTDEKPMPEDGRTQEYSFFPSDPKKLKARIRSYERALVKDASDGYGKRYLLGPMYLLISDIEGALRHYVWFHETYPDDGGEPYHRLFWALALFKAQSGEAADRRLRDAHYQNLYLIPHVLGMKSPPYPIWHSSNVAEPAYAEEMPVELLPRRGSTGAHHLFKSSLRGLAIGDAQAVITPLFTKQH